MKIFPLFRDTSASFQLFLFLGLLLFGALFGMLIGFIIVQFTQGVNIFASGINLLDAGNLNTAIILQISTQLGLFILPPFLFSWLVSENPLTFLGWNSVSEKKIFIPAILLMFASLPFIHSLAQLNQMIQLPEWLSGLESWMQQKEEEAEKMTQLFLNVTTINGLLINLMMIGLLPALGEELVFRSIFQPVLARLLRNKHLGIIFAALLFSIMHFQFYGLIPRFALGLFLGYFYHWSGSIWVPVMMHLANNAAAVIAYYLHFNGFTATPMDEFGASSGSFLFISSVIFSGLLIIAASRLSWLKSQ